VGSAESHASLRAYKSMIPEKKWETGFRSDGVTKVPANYAQGEKYRKTSLFRSERVYVLSEG